MDGWQAPISSYAPSACKRGSIDYRGREGGRRKENKLNLESDSSRHVLFPWSPLRDS
jgi:hypothetical protein